jgi:hypothetical protein
LQEESRCFEAFAISARRSWPRGAKRTFTLNGCLVLVAEDEQLIALDVAEAIRGHGGKAIEVGTCAAAFEAVEQHHFDAAILAIWLTA